MKYKTIAIIMAAGSGSRFKTEQTAVPKQYLQIKNKILLTIILEKFLAHPEIDAVLPVINKQHSHFYKKAAINLNLLPVAIGGTTRQASVRNGLNALLEYSPENVLIHDAARIFVKPNQISQVIEKLKNYQAVTLGARIVDSLRYADKIKTKNIDRENLFMIQTPQGFKYHNILSWHNKLKDKNFTDDISLAEYAGCNNIKIIDSSIENFKLTTKNDLDLISRYIDIKD